MRRLFLRFYLALGAVLLASFAAVMVTSPPAEPPGLDRQIRAMAGVWPAEVAAPFGAARDQPGHAEVARALAEELGVQVAILPEEAVVGSVGGFVRSNLAQGQPVVQLHGAGPAIFVPIPGHPFVAELRPGPPPPSWGGRRGALLAALVLLGIGVAIYFVLRPVESQLERISAAAAGIGRGELGARAVVTRDDAAGRLAGTFNEMADRVQTIVDGRRALLHAVSHELRTPLARLRFAVELLDSCADPASRGQRVEEMLGDVGELEELVSELLRYSEMEEARPDLRPADICEIVGGIVDEARRLRPDVQVGWEPAELPPLSLDRRLVARSIGNLVTNAVRYSAGRVLVRAEREQGSVHIVVDDDGPGIPAEDRERVFLPFVRLDPARSRDEGGAGLGLALAQRAARLHGGSISVADSHLGGARFTWSIPGPGGAEQTSGSWARLAAPRGGGRPGPEDGT